MFNINIKREPKCMSFFTTFKTQTKKFVSKFLTAKKFYIKRDDKVSKVCVFLHKIQNKEAIDTPIDKIMTKYLPS